MLKTTLYDLEILCHKQTRVFCFLNNKQAQKWGNNVHFEKHPFNYTFDGTGINSELLKIVPPIMFNDPGISIWAIWG